MASCTVSPSAVVVELLNLDNYEYWSQCVQSYLVAEGLWKIVEATDDPPKPEDGERFDCWTRQHAKALHVIQISSGSAFFPVISDVKSAGEAWNMLKNKLSSDSYLPTNSAGDTFDNNSANYSLDQKAFLALLNTQVVEWDAVLKSLEENREAARIKDPQSGKTCLHTAVLKGDADVVAKILGFLEEKDLEEKDQDGKTAFFHAVWNGKLEKVKLLHRKNKKLANIRSDHGPKGVIPVLLAIWAFHKDVADYLYPLTPNEDLDSQDGHNANGAEIITQSIQKNYFDFARNLIQRYPKLVITKDHSGYYPIVLLAGMRSAFLSGTSLSFWQRWIYNCIHIQDLPKLENHEANQMYMIKSGIFNRIYKMKLVHVRVLELLKLISQLIKEKKIELHDPVMKRAIFRAIRYGHVEFVTVLMEHPTFPALWDIFDDKRRGIFGLAIECRQEKIYNLLYDILDDGCILGIGNQIDILQNSLLHIVGTLSPKIKSRDAALEMQRELQWFKEIESLVPSSQHQFVNFADNMTGHELFTKNHKDLAKEGEKSMKETATSCTVVGALIITIMFSVAFAVAGGNDGRTGLPVFLKERMFTVFIISDALSLFFSTTSVVIFLGILTSRYAENDFLTSLPTKMMVGLMTLFFSIATMIVTFSATLIMMLRQKYSWIVFPIILLACIPITAFVFMQSPLLYELCVSTYGPGIFQKKRRQSRRHRLKELYARTKGRVVRAFTPKLKNKV